MYASVNTSPVARTPAAVPSLVLDAAPVHSPDWTHLPRSPQGPHGIYVRPAVSAVAQGAASPLRRALPPPRQRTRSRGHDRSEHQARVAPDAPDAGVMAGDDLTAAWDTPRGKDVAKNSLVEKVQRQYQHMPLAEKVRNGLALLGLASSLAVLWLGSRTVLG